MSHDTSKAIGRGYRVARAAFALCGLLFASFCFAKSVPGASLWGSVLHHASAQRDDGASADRPGYHFRNIEDIRVGDRVVAENPELPIGAPSDFGRIDPATWRILKLRMSKANGGWVNIELARPVTWIEAVGANQANTIRLTIEEFQISGIAEVLAIRTCPAIKPGTGRIVTGTFGHSVANVVDLAVEGLDAPIGTTANHPFWSEDRQSFVQAGALNVGESLRRHDSSFTHVLSLQPRSTAAAVYNLEVDGEHVYFVTEKGVLVHNAGPSYNEFPFEPGPHAGQGVPASRPNKPPTAAEQAAVNAQGGLNGCHTCGAPTSGTSDGHWIFDHQPPSALNPGGGPQVGYPHCTTCSASQGGSVRAEVARRR